MKDYFEVLSEMNEKVREQALNEQILTLSQQKRAIHYSLIFLNESISELEDSLHRMEESPMKEQVKNVLRDYRNDREFFESRAH